MPHQPVPMLLLGAMDALEGFLHIGSDVLEALCVGATEPDEGSGVGLKFLIWDP